MLSDESLVTVRDEAQAATWVVTRDDVAADIAGLRAVEAAVRADQIETDAAIAERDHRPTGYGLGALNSGSRSQWYSRGRDQAGDAIRAQLKGVSDE